MGRALKTYEIMDRLAIKLSPPEWAFLREVADGTGINKRRTADAIAMNLWPSRGMELWGFEVKASRGDWLNELRNPAKGDAIQQYCDRWWIVIGDKSIIKEGELPPTWGLMVPYGKGLQIKIKAPLLREQKAGTFPRSFLAGVLRNASTTLTWDARIWEIKKKAKEEGEEEARKRFSFEKEQHESFEARVKKFEEASGLKLTGFQGYNLSHLGVAVKVVMGAGWGNVLWSLENGVEVLEKSLKSMKAVTAKLKEEQVKDDTSIES